MMNVLLTVSAIDLLIRRRFGSFDKEHWTIEFRDAGIVAHGIAFCPWDSIVSYHWGELSDLNLVVKSRDGTSYYPLEPQEKALVEPLLQERLAA